MQGFVNYSLAFIFMLAGASSFELISANFDYVSKSVSKYKCEAEGRFPHPVDCGAYVECVRYPGIFKRRFGSCHGALFDSQNKTCRTSYEDFECRKPVRVARAIATEHRYNSLCSDVPNGFICADCKTAINCVDGKAYKESCSAFDTCAIVESFGGAVCYPASGDSCSCNASNTFFADNYDSESFFFCSDVDGEPDMYHCPEGMVFDEHARQCVNVNGMPHCTEAGIFPHYENCSSYYTCITSANGWVQKAFSCENNLMYNEDSGLCEDPCEWDMGDFTCEGEGRFSDPLSCGHYYECISLGTNNFRMQHRKCPEGYEWTETGPNHGHCIIIGTSNCTTVSVSKCVIPAGQCPGGTLSDLPDSTIPDPGSSLDIGRAGSLSVNVPIQLLNGNNHAFFRRVSSVPSGTVPAHTSLWNIGDNRGNRRSREVLP